MSSNPALLAIQRAKAEAAAQAKASVGRGSLDTARSVEQPVLSTALSASYSPSKPVDFKAEQTRKNAEESETSMLREGWWAKTEAGGMNAEDSQHKPKAASHYVPQSLPASIASPNKLDFSSMFKAAAADTVTGPVAVLAAPTPPADNSARAAAAPSAAVDMVASVIQELETKVTISKTTAVTSPIKTDIPKGDAGSKNWWDKMDNKVLNEKDIEAAKGTQSSFQPQFMGSGLVNRLDFSKRE